MSEEPEPLTDRQLEIIEIIVWVIMTLVVMFSVWFPYVAVVYLFIRWAVGVLGLLERSGKRGE